MNFLFYTGNTIFQQVWSKNQNCQVKLKLGNLIDSDMHNSMMMFIFPIFHWKYPFWANLVQKIKIACEIRFLDLLEYPEFSGDSHFFRF